MFLGISSMIVASMMDTVYIGLLGADELAAISFTFPLIMALTLVVQYMDVWIVALGRPIPTTVLALLRMIVIYIPLAMLLNLFWGYIGIFLATTIANFIMAGLAFYWSRSTLARERRRLEREPEIA